MCIDVYIAPEVYKNEPFDRSVDVFAFGLILYEVRKAIQSTCKESRLIMCCILADVSLRWTEILSFSRLHCLPVLWMVLVQMIEGTPAFHPKPQEEAAKMICLEGLRPTFKNKPKYYPSDVKEWVNHTLYLLEELCFTWSIEFSCQPDHTSNVQPHSTY